MKTKVYRPPKNPTSSPGKKFISVVMAYFNRPEVTLNTLRSINRSSYKNFEVIIVDDGSDPELKISPHLTNEFNFPIKVIEIEKEKKLHTNSCVPYNKGFQIATGDLVIIQNPESLHVGDVLTFCNENIKQNKYITFAAYSIGPEKLPELKKACLEADGLTKLVADVNYLFSPYEERNCDVNSLYSWYNHSKFRQAEYHFLSCMMREDLYDLGGFDEAFADGLGFDDNEFITRIRRKKMDRTIVDSPFCIHQYHDSASGHWSPEETVSRSIRNQMAFNSLFLPERINGWRAENEQTPLKI
jgi:glycosyltransferase involved in cell wall biosynthesis